MILCECGEFIKGNVFKDYIRTSINPSTSTIGHCRCGLLFDFIDHKKSCKYSSKQELKSIAMRFAENLKMDHEVQGRFLLEVDRLKKIGKFSDHDILVTAYRKL